MAFIAPSDLPSRKLLPVRFGESVAGVNTR